MKGEQLMTLTAQDGTKTNLYAGLYLRTRKQTRFWGWSNARCGGLSAAVRERPLGSLAEWLRLAHATLDRDRSPVPDIPSTPSAFFPAPRVDEHEAAQRARKNRRLQFVCNRHFIGLLIR
jgi:hypothetical protein